MTLISFLPLRRLAHCVGIARWLRNALSGLPRTPADAVRRLTDRWIESIPDDPWGDPEITQPVGHDDDVTLDLSPDEYQSMFARVNTRLPTTRQSV